MTQAIWNLKISKELKNLTTKELKKQDNLDYRTHLNYKLIDAKDEKILPKIKL